MKHALVAILLLWIVTACDDGETRLLRGNTGNQGEILVVAPTSFWSNADKAEQLRTSLNSLLPGLPAAETMFKFVEVTAEGFTDIFKTHRNILEIVIDPSDETKVELKRDVYARQQTYAIIKLRSLADLVTVNETRIPQILWYFHKAEIDRLISRNKSFGSAELNQQIAEKTGLNIIMQEGFVMAREADNFIWLRLDRQKPVGGYQHDIKQGIMIYSRPYTDTSQFNNSSLWKWKDGIDSTYIEGPAGSHMTISRKLYDPEFFALSFHDQSAREIRGLWRMEGAKGVHMGGPFYSLTFYNPENQKQYMVEGYVYGPQFDKTAFVREVEAIAKSVSPLTEGD